MHFDAEWDAKDMSCGDLVLDLRSRLRKMPGKVLKVIARDPGAPSDLPAWCKMTGDELAIARALLAEKLKDVGTTLPGPVSMTAISRPVSRGVLPAVARLSGAKEGGKRLRLAELTAAIERVARLSMEETAVELGGSTGHLDWLLSDMILVEGLLVATGGDTLAVAEIDLTNIPGLLADERAFAWRQHYGCYVERLRSQGIVAYASDPLSCP